MSAPKSPGTTRTSRNVALEKGTNPGGFSEQLYPKDEPLEHDTTANLPVSQGSPINPATPYTSVRSK